MIENRKKKTLLDMDRLPTREEMREFFRANDWTAQKPYDFNEWEQDKIEVKNCVQDVFNGIWHQEGKNFGQKASPVCYTKDYPPEVLKKGVGDIVSGRVTEIMENEELCNDILTHFMPDFPTTEEEWNNLNPIDPEQVAKVDKFVNTAMNTMLDTIGFEGAVKAAQEFGTPEDFSSIMPNLPKMNFEKKYNHSRAKTKVVYSNLALERAQREEEILKSTPDELAENSALVNDFFKEIGEEDGKILRMLLDGMTQKEIADKLGYKNHSGVNKRIKKMREKYMEFDPDFKYWERKKTEE